MHVNAIRILAGAVLLFFGRKLYWLLVGVLGFLAGMTIAEKFLHGQSQMVFLIVACLGGILGTVLAIFLQKVAIAVAGFLAGGYFVNVLMASMALHFGQLDWAVVLIGAIIGAIFGIVLFDWALILFSSITGALLIVQSVHLTSLMQAAAFIVLLIIGISVQSRFKSEPQRSKD